MPVPRPSRPLWIAMVVVVLAGAFTLDRHLSAPTSVEARAARLVAPPRRLLGGASSAARHGWLTAWGASPQPLTLPGRRAGTRALTVRNVLTTSAAGRAVRVRLTNAFGRVPLTVARTTVALAGRHGAVATPARITFRGRRTVTLPPGADIVSDAAPLAVPALAHVAVSVTVRRPGAVASGHRVAQRTSFIAAGRHALDADGRAFRAPTTSWFFVDGLDVLAAPGPHGTVVAFGDSITDGVGAGLNADARWPDALARRLQAAGSATTGVLDAGISGNRVLHDTSCCGVAGVGRFAMDALTATAARTVVVLEGTNDIGFGTGDDPAAAARRITAGYERLIRAAHRAGLRILGGTLAPFGGAHYWSPAKERTRAAVNHWIATSGAFDGVIDFARALADPRDPERLRPAYDSGDHLHPDAAGYRAMAAAVPLERIVVR